MQRHTSDNHDHGDHKSCCLRMFSWSPIIGGALIGLGLGFLLNLFAMGIGLTAYTTDPDGATALAIGGFIGLLIGGIASMFISGMATGYFAAPRCGGKNYGIAYGFLAWCLGILIMAMLASNIGNYMSGYAFFTGFPNKISATLSTVGNTGEAVATKIHPASDARDSAEERNARAIGLASLSTFILFFIGAFSACVGGYCGFRCWEKCHHQEI